MSLPWVFGYSERPFLWWEKEPDRFKRSSSHRWDSSLLGGSYRYNRKRIGEKHSILNFYAYIIIRGNFTYNFKYIQFFILTTESFSCRI